MSIAEADLDSLPSENNQPREPLCTLIQRYLDVTVAAGKEPVFSLMPALRLYGFLLLWEFGLAITPFVILINGVIALVRVIPRVPRPRYVPLWAISSIANAFKSLHAGEIPAIKLFVNRNLVRLFALLHARGRIADLTSGTRLQYVESVLVRDKEFAVLSDAEGRFLDAANRGFTEKKELKALLIVLPSVELVGKAIALSPLAHIPLRSILTALTGWLGFHHLEGPIGVASQAHDTLQILTIMSYVLLLFASCLVRKRQLFLEYEIYKYEHSAAVKTGITIAREMPVDLLCWIAIVVIPAVTLGVRLAMSNRTSIGDNDYAVLGLTAAYVAPFIYASIRRFQIGNR